MTPNPGQREKWIPRKRLVERLKSEGIFDARVLEAFLNVPRHLFVPKGLEGQSYQDSALPIGEGQTISAPGIVALMSQELKLTGSEKVLEIGTGSGFQAAILSKLAKTVHSIERIPELAETAQQRLAELGFENVCVHLGDGSEGLPNETPFDGIIVTAGGPKVPLPLLEQLVPQGRLIGPFGPKGVQDLLLYTKDSAGAIHSQSLAKCQF